MAAWLLVGFSWRYRSQGSVEPVWAYGTSIIHTNAAGFCAHPAWGRREATWETGEDIHRAPKILIPNRRGSILPYEDKFKLKDGSVIHLAASVNIVELLYENGDDGLRLSIDGDSLMKNSKPASDFICTLLGLTLLGLGVSALAQEPIVYPAQGQSSAQMAADKAEC